MTTPPRWLAPLLDAADLCLVPLPWERGERRDAAIARRTDVPPRPDALRRAS